MAATNAVRLGNSPVAVTAARGWRRFLAFSGPAYLISVGYMDPGNWATDLEGGARFGYRLLWVLVLSNIMAILLQTLSARLGIATGRDLAQSCRERYPRQINFALWVLCEAAIAACDLAEVLGAAIALNLLFKLPLMWGVVIAALDTLVILSLSRYGIRVIERIVLGLVVVITGCFAVQIFMIQPNVAEIAQGLIPSGLGNGALYVAIGMLGATVMPHNLYLHSALVQTREIGTSEESKREASWYNFLDSAFALNAALLVNAAVLILSGAVFFKNGIVVTEIQQAHEMLTPLVGTALASVLFAVALLASGQSSTITGTMAGQIVMEGFLNLRMTPWLRRLITRLIAIIPAVLTIHFAGEQATLQLLIFSQVILSIQLPFAIIPLIHFTSDKARMGSLVSSPVLRVTAWLTAGLIVFLNAWLAAQTLSGWIGFAIAAPLGLLLAYIVVEPRISKRWLPDKGVLPIPAVDETMEMPRYQLILVPLDHTEMDRVALQHAHALAKLHQASLLLLHVEEGVASQVYGDQAETAEEKEGAGYLQRVTQKLRNEGIPVESVVAYSARPRQEIVQFARKRRPDLIVMGAHGHKGLKDIIFGSTINAVRHNLDIPVFVVRKPH